MKFETLKDRMNYYRELADTRLIPKLPVLLMLDGRSFSKIIKKRFKRPFDDTFIEAMDYAAVELCKEIQGTKIAYVQSDEISIFISDYRTQESESWMGYRLCKLLSIPPSIATGAWLDKIRETCPEMPRVQFDCKAWNVPSENDVFAWFLHRQNDCVRNSKQQTAQTWISHKELNKLNTDEQIRLLKDKTTIDWETFDDRYKFGRLIIKTKEPFHNEATGSDYERNVWKSIPAFQLNTEEGKLNFLKYVKD